MVFDPDRPIASENLSDSQPLLLSNNRALDTSFGVDHYKFSDGTENNGFHNQVTTPAQGSIPETTSNPVFFGYKQTANLGVLQYSAGPSGAVITPLTKIYSPSTPISIGNSSSTPLLDFTGIVLAQALVLFTYTLVSGGTFNQLWSVRYQTGPSTTVVSYNTFTPGLTLEFSGSVLSIVSNNVGASTNLFWTLDFERIQT
jgi:hypothetical protein